MSPYLLTERPIATCGTFSPTGVDVLKGKGTFRVNLVTEAMLVAGAEIILHSYLAWN